MSPPQLWRDFDWALLGAVLTLCGIGIAMVYSATFSTVDLQDYWFRQLVFAVSWPGGAVANCGV